MDAGFEALGSLLDQASDEAERMLALLTQEQQALHARDLDRLAALVTDKQALSAALGAREQGLAHWLKWIESQQDEAGLSARAIIRQRSPALAARLMAFLETLEQCRERATENGQIVNIRLGHLRRSIDALLEARGGVSGYWHPLGASSMAVPGATLGWVA